MKDIVQLKSGISSGLARNDMVVWFKLIWDSHVIQRHSLISQMSVLGRLPLQDRFHKQELNTELDYVLCGTENECISHLFFECIYLKRIQQQVLNHCCISRKVLSFKEELAWAATKLKGKSLITSVFQNAWKSRMLTCTMSKKREREFKEERPKQRSIY